MTRMNYLTIWLFKMKKIILLGFLFLSINLFAQDFPAKSDKLVNDFTNTLTSDQLNNLEQKLLAYNDSTSTQVAVVIMKSIGAYEVADYANKLAESWGIGQKAKDNGILLLIALDDRKVTIQTGYGLEGVLPDAICKRIIENDIKPAFKKQDYFTGIDNATTTIFKFAAGEYTADNYSKKSKKNKIPKGLLIVAFIFFVFFASRNKGNGGGGIGTRGRGIPPIWFGGMGGGSFGNFSGGGGSFGGFGGGSFGGGGASGSW